MDIISLLYNYRVRTQATLYQQNSAVTNIAILYLRYAVIIYIYLLYIYIRYDDSPVAGYPRRDAKVIVFGN